MRPAPLATMFALACAEGNAADVRVSYERAAPPATGAWPVTGGDPGNTRWSPLAQIDRGNVGRLRVAWTYRAGDLPAEGPSEIQATPILVDGMLYASTPGLAAVALDAATGEERWRFDPGVGRTRERHANRGLAHWRSGAESRVFFPAGRRLWALDARTGRPVPSFGDSGSVDLAAGLGRDIGTSWMLATSPGVVFDDLLIQGTRVGEWEGSAPGHVRAYDVRTGKIRWTFHTIPRPGEPGHETWPAGAWRTAGGANSWAGMSVDLARGLVFVPTGSATPDFYGGARAGRNLFANSLVALDARTGRRAWHFQAVRHDLWDRDLPAAPSLVTVTRGGRRVDALAQITKHGYVFVLDRATGRPLFPVRDVPAPPSDLRGERAWPSQPAPSLPLPFARQAVTAESLTVRTPAARDSALARFRTLRRGLWAPPSREGTIVLPGFDGGGEWGGAAVDPSGVLYVNASDVPWIARMRDPAADARVKELVPPAAASGAARDGRAVYAAACASCHGAGRRGDGGRVPSLVDVGKRLTADDIASVVRHGRGFMPAVPLPDAERRAVAAYLLGRAAPAATAHDAEPRPARAAVPYEFAGYERWRDPDGFPAIRPPWGTISAIDLNTGAYRWRVPLGRHPALPDTGAPTGTEQYGGPIVTAGGLVFVAATMDARIRALDRDTGRELWSAPLPAAGFATPMTYLADGRQYVVVAAGGGKLGLPRGDAYVAFALPE